MPGYGIFLPNFGAKYTFLEDFDLVIELHSPKKSFRSNFIKNMNSMKIFHNYPYLGVVGAPFSRF